MAFLHGFHQFLLLIAFLASLLSVLGGGFILPVLKNVYWIHTGTCIVGVYGGCPSPPWMGFWEFDSSHWTQWQSNCWYFFKNEPSTLPGTLDKIESEVYFILLALVSILSFCSLVTFQCADAKTSGAISLFSFVLQGTVFGLAVAAFTNAMRESSLQPNHWMDYFGPGLYLAGSSAILFLICGCLALKLHYESIFHVSQLKRANYEIASI